MEVRRVRASGIRSRATVPEATVRQIHVAGGEVVTLSTGADTVWRGTSRVLTGTIHDSLSRRPVAAAAISLRGTGISARSAEDGKFRLENVLPGGYVAEVRTDSMSLLGAVVAVPVTISGDQQPLAIRLPPLSTLGRVACGASVATLVAGRVTQGSDALPDAQVVVEWTAPSDDSTVTTRSRDRWLTAQTDGRGLFRVCGAPESVSLTVRAESPRGAARVATMVDRATKLALVSLEARPVAEATLTGAVLSDINGAPMSDVEIILPELARTTYTDARGQYRVNALPPGTHRVQARRIGFRLTERRVTLVAGRTTRDTVLMSRVPLLDTVAVQASRNLRDFEEHRRLGLGAFFTREDLAKFDGRSLSSVLLQTSTVRVIRGSSAHAWIAGGRRTNFRTSTRVVHEIDRAKGAPGACYSQVYLDNLLVYKGKVTSVRNPEPLFDIDMIPPESVEAIEFYSGVAQTPTKYFDADDCGVLVIHTRRYEPKRRDSTGVRP